MWCFFLLLSAFAHYGLSQSQRLNVNTTEGIVVGASAADGNYFAFYGLFYGGHMTGESRFKAPTPPDKYPGEFVAHDANVICARPSPNGLIGTEHCLTVNIFTNATTPAKPVLVWLTGEEYTNSTTVGSFRRFVSEGVVVVQMNYRLSIFGFLCLGVEQAPGNAGLKDVVQGLRWIQSNIGGFGGDPNNVILFGHGSAAAMVDLITLSPLANGLVHKAIALSGSALAPWAVAYDPAGYAHALGAKLDYNGKDNEELAKLLATTNLSLLSAALTDPEFDFYNNTILFAPCIENAQLNASNTFLADAPINILRSGNYSQIPYLTGYVDAEGTIRAEHAVFRQWLQRMQSNFSLFLQADLDFKDNFTNVERSIREFYFGQRVINIQTVQDFMAYQGDTLILVSVIRGARERALRSRAEVRLLEFSYRGTMNSDWMFPTVPLYGARHGSILNYLVDYDLRPVDEPVMTSLIRRFVAFFNTGVPNAAVNPGATWSPITENSLEYLLYSGSDSPNPQSIIYIEEGRTNPHTQRMTLWNDLYSRYYTAPKSVSSAGGMISAAMVIMLGQMILRLF